MRVSIDGELVITNPTAEDVGVYSCVAVSSAGSASVQVHVKIPSKNNCQEPGDRTHTDRNIFSFFIQLEIVMIWKRFL